MAEPTTTNDETFDMDAEPIYDPATDTMFLFLKDGDRRAVGQVQDENLTVLLRPEDGELVGLEISHFLSEVVLERPELEILLHARGVPEDAALRIRRRIDSEKRAQIAASALMRGAASKVQQSGQCLTEAKFGELQFAY